MNSLENNLAFSDDELIEWLRSINSPYAVKSANRLFEILELNKVLKNDINEYSFLKTIAYIGIANHPKPHEVWCLKLPNPKNCKTISEAIKLINSSQQ